jgi:hypothetical protein
MQHNQTTSQTVIINTDIYTKYDTITPTIINETKVLQNNLNKSVVYPTMFDRWRDF